MKGDSGFPVRLCFTKRGKVRFVSHRDVARALERAFRIEQLPLAFTLGFSPRPKVSFGLALSVGHESDAEYLDVELAEPVDVDALPARLSDALPEGIDVTGAAALADRAPSLQEAISEIWYRTEVVDANGDAPRPELLHRAVDATLRAEELVVTRTRKGVESTDDVRAVVRDLQVVDDPCGPVLELRLATRPRVPRPSEIVAAVELSAGAGLREARVLRTHQWIERADDRLSPLTADSRISLVEARAS